jgi:hypothetical protein
MDTLLLVITLISAATAIAALASARRLRHTERERSEARVAALAQAADTHGGTDGGWTSVAGEWQWMPEPSQQSGIRDLGLGIGAATGVTRSSREARSALIPNPESPIPGLQPLIPETEAEISSGTFFGTVQREEPSGSRLPIFAAAALIVMLGGALIFLNTSASNDRAATVAHVNQPEPLELVALGHAREISVLTITGTVRNPASGAKLEGLTAVVSLLDRGGALVSTKDVPLDYRALGPGEEAPFKVSIPDPGSIARYRVSFRAGTDVVPHVDRRTDTKLASALQ